MTKSSTEPTIDARLIRAFLQELSCTLDLTHTMTLLDITPDRVREILGAMVPASDPPAWPEESMAASTATDEKPEKKHKVDSLGLYTSFVDGASRGNPGLAGAGIYFIGPDGKPFKRLKKFLGSATNNVAEYSALIVAVESAIALGIKRLRVRGDSELVVKQIKGLYRVKSPDLKQLYERVTELVRSFDSFEIGHVRREGNAEADALANEAIDTRPSGS